MHREASNSNCSYSEGKKKKKHSQFFISIVTIIRCAKQEFQANVISASETMGFTEKKKKKDESME